MDDRTLWGDRKTKQDRSSGGGKPAAIELAGLSVALVAPLDEQNLFLARELQRLRTLPRHIWPMPDIIPADVDVVFCDYSGDLAMRLPWVPGDARAALVVLLPSTKPIQLEALAHATPDAVLSQPFTTNAVVASIVLARSHFRYEQRLRNKIGRLDENLRSMRNVERAKAILMTTKRIPENEAYNFIRKQAMDRRVSTSAVATAIINSFEILDYGSKH
jgi:AmiR/NasT family two-component response regulator